MSDILSHLAVSQRVSYEDLDWDLARRVGLSEREIGSLRHFADVEGQTVYYFLEVVTLEAARDPELLTFLTMWNYEEYFHAHALTRLLKECGVAVEAPSERSGHLRRNANFRATFEDFVQRLIARVAPRQFVALWMFWGALQECLTMQAYEELIRNTENPVLAELLRRIAKQERRHFAYYYGQAKRRLENDLSAQRLCRFLVDNFYAPVGSNVKRENESVAEMERLFPGERIFAAMGYVEERLSKLPGMAGLNACTKWAERHQPRRTTPTPTTAKILMMT